MQFLHYPLTWGFLLVLLPLLIHLINLMRQRRVRWAAMDFLLQAYKKHRKWIWLKQLLLLLLRMLAIAAVVAMLAQLVTRQQWLSFFGGQTVHHIVLLDDSFSMSDRESDAAAFDRATRAIGSLTQRLGQGHAVDGETYFSVFRFSQAAQMSDAQAALVDSQAEDDPATPGNAGRTEIADLNRVAVDKSLPMLWEEKRLSMNVSQLATGPQPALALAADLVEQRPDEQQVVYVFSDFREDPWSNPTRLEEPLQRLKDQGVTVNLVRCVDEQRPNLAITRLEPSPGTLAAGVPLFVDVEVKNFGREPAEHVLVDFHTVFHDDELTESPSSPSLSREELPKLDIDRIAPGESVVRRVQVYFPKAGQHAVAAELPADPVAADNRRWCVIQLPAAVPVLVIDGDTQQRNAEFLVSAFRPGRTVETGIRPDVQPESFLRDSTDETLNAYRSIFLLDVGRLDDLAVSNLRRYVESGGGVSFFLGPHSSIEFLRELHDDGKGLFPQPIDRMDLLQPNTTDSPDLQVESHPLFEVLAGEQNAYLRSILVRQYFRTRRDWIPPADSTVNILARLRNGQPLVVERHWGEGRVMALSTTLAPDWNNWATQPTFVVFMLELQAYLQRPNDASTLRLVGNPIELQLDAANVTPEVICSLPALSGLDDGPRREVRKTLQDVSSAEAALTKVTLGEARSAVGEDTNLAGIYEFWTRTVEGNLHVDRYALNVDTRESDLALVAAPALADRLPEDQVAIFAANEGSFGTSDDDRYSWSHFLMYAVAAMLVGEQLLAYSASYHAGAKGGRS